MKKKFGPDDRRVSTILDRLGYVHFSRSRYSETEDVWNRSLRIKEKIFGTESREVADLFHKLAEFHRHRGNFNEAEALYDRALMIMRKKLALDNKVTEKLLEHYSACITKPAKGKSWQVCGKNMLPSKRWKTQRRSSPMNQCKMVLR